MPLRSKEYQAGTDGNQSSAPTVDNSGDSSYVDNSDDHDKTFETPAQGNKHTRDKKIYLKVQEALTDCGLSIDKCALTNVGKVGIIQYCHCLPKAMQSKNEVCYHSSSSYPSILLISFTS